MPPKGKKAKQQSKDGERIEVDPGQYKKTLKLLKSSKAPKLLDGLKACYDHNFIRDGGALAPLMGVFNAKKISVDVVREAIMAVADFCDPPKIDGQPTFSSNGLLLINKKSNGFKGLQRVAKLIPHDDLAISTNAVRTIYGVVRSFNENGLGSAEEPIYRSKLSETENLVSSTINVMINSGEYENADDASIRAIQLYGNLCVTQLLRADVGNNEAHMVVNVTSQLVSTLKSAIVENDDAEAEEVDTISPSKPQLQGSAELYLISKATWSSEGQIRLASNGAIQCLVDVINKISNAMAEVDFSLPSEGTSVELKHVLENLSLASDALLRIAKCCFASNDDRLADLFAKAEDSNNDGEDDSTGLTVAKTKLMVCMENAAVAIATAWNLVAKKNESAEIVQIATILRVMGTLVTCSEEYSEDIKTILGENKCLPALFNILLNDPKNAASAEKVLMGLITFSFGDRKGTYDGRVCGGNEETAWLPASMIVNAINDNFENPDKVTFVARAIRLLACLTQNMENAMAIGKVPDANLVPKLINLIAKVNDGVILPPESPEDDVQEGGSVREQPSEETPTKSKKKKKSKKPKKLSLAELRAKREAMVNVGVNSTLKYVYNRGKMVGSEICVYAIRILGNISQYDSVAAKALGSEPHGGPVIATLFKLGTETSDESIATMYEPLNSRWQEDIASQINAIKNARLKKLDIAFESGAEIDEEEAKKDILKSDVGEKHPSTSIQIEALNALEKFAESDTIWRRNALMLAKRNAEEDASETEIKQAADESEEIGLGNAICKLLNSYVKRMNDILEGKDEKCNSRSAGTSMQVLEVTCSIVSGLINAKGGRRAVLDAFGYSEPLVSLDGSTDTKSAFKVTTGDELRTAEQAMLQGVLAIIKGDGGASISLRQRLCAIRTLRVMCRDEKIEHPKQSLEADMLCQEAIRGGALAHMISLLNYQRVLTVNEKYDEDFIGTFKREISEFIAYLVSRGTSREGYYVKPGEEPRSVPLPGADEATPNADEAEAKSRPSSGKSTKSRPNSGKSSGKKSRPNSGKSAGKKSRPNSKKGKKKGKKGKTAEPEEKPVVEVIGVDPNAGPTKEQWATILNLTFTVDEYEHNSRTPLHIAVVGENQAQISQLLSAGADVNISDAQNISPLHSALAQGLDKIVNDLIFIGGSRVDAVTTWGDTVLKYAFVSPSSRKLKALLQYHKEEHSDEEMEPVPGNARFVKTLLEQSADITTCDADGNYPAHWVINGTSVTYRFDGQNVTLSNQSAYFGPDSNYLERIKELLSFGFVDRVNGCNKFGQSALHSALARGMTDVATLLLHNGANPNIVDGEGNLPLHIVSIGWALHASALTAEMLRLGDGKTIVKGSLNSADVARGLTKLEREELDVENYISSAYVDIVVSPKSALGKPMPKPSLIGLKNALGYTPLHYACGGNIESETPLGIPTGKCPFKGCEMQKPIDDEEELHKRETILNNRKEIAQIMLAAGGDANVIGANGLRPLHCLAKASADWHGHLDEELCDMLLKYEAELNHVDTHGRIGGGGSRFSALHYAIEANQFTLAWYLINRGAQIHPPTCNPPLLHMACEHGAGADMVGYILAHGEDANIRGEGIHKGHRKYCGTALQLACANGQSQIVYGLLSHPEYAVDVDAVRAHNGRTALHLASFHGHLDCVKYLVEDGNADPNVLCLAKETALFSAIRGGSADVVGYLLERCKLRLANEATGENGIIIAEQLNIDDPSKASHAKVVETILTSISDSELSEIEHLHECYKSRKSLKAYEDQLAAEAAKAAALAEEQRKAEELEVARSMVEAIFEIADTDGVGHLNAAALNALHERIGAGIDFHDQMYEEISEAIGASAEKGWNGEDLLNAYLGDHHCFDLDRDHQILFPPEETVENSE